MGIQINGNTDIISPDDGSLTIQGTTNFSALQVNSQNLPNAGPLSNRNLIINGAMQVAQRGTQVTGVTAAGYRTCDRFYIWIGTLGTWTIDQSTDAPDGFSSSLKATCTTEDSSPTGSDYAYFSHRIEAQNLQHLNYGSSAAQELTLSFWVKSNKTGNATVALLQRDNSHKLLSPQYTISSADTWEYKTISIPADTSGTINNDNGIGLELEFPFNAGPDYSGGDHQTTWSAYNSTNRYPSLLGVGGATNDYFAITGVQLEIGEVATPFEHRSYGDELARCQRYCYMIGRDQTYSHMGMGQCTSTTVGRALVVFPQTMRTEPSFTTSGDFLLTNAGNSAASISSIAEDVGSRSNYSLECTVASGLVAGNSTRLAAYNDTSAYILFSAEL